MKSQQRRRDNTAAVTHFHEYFLKAKRRHNFYNFNFSTCWSCWTLNPPLIMQQKPAKFQVYWSAGSIVMRPPNFAAPKRVSTPKGAQICPQIALSCLQVEISKNHVHRPIILKRNGWKLLHLWPTVLTGTQTCPIPIGQVRDRIWKFADCHVLDIIMQQNPAKFQVYWSTVSIVVRSSNFGAPKRAITPKGAQICFSSFAGGDI